MGPTHFAVIVLAQTTNQPAVPGAKANEGSTPIQQAPAGTTRSTSQGSGTGSSNPFGSLWIFLLPLIVLVLMSTMGGKKQQKQRTAMLSALSKNDRVLTSGGVIGTIVELYDQEMVLRVDESSNTRIRFSRSAVQQILRESKDAPRGDLEVKPDTETASSR